MEEKWNDELNVQKYIFSFGKYRGCTYWQVYYYDPKYLLWCIGNVPWFRVSQYRIDQVKNKIIKNDSRKLVKRYGKYVPVSK